MFQGVNQYLNKQSEIIMFQGTNKQIQNKNNSITLKIQLTTMDY